MSEHEWLSSATSEFRIYRGQDAPPLGSAKERTFTPDPSYQPGPVITDGLARLQEAGFRNGGTGRLLYSGPGLHVSYVWFKNGFPLPLHSHSADCLRVGTETLTVGDGVFVPAEVPYTFTPGPDGVEILEIRTSSDFDSKYRSRNPAYWDKAVATVEAHQAQWHEEAQPYGAVPL
jgi:hypothetical protein